MLGGGHSALKSFAKGSWEFLGALWHPAGVAAAGQGRCEDLASVRLTAEAGGWLTTVTGEPGAEAGVLQGADLCRRPAGSAGAVEPAAYYSRVVRGQLLGPAASRGGVAHKQGCFYLLASACGFLRHSAGTIIKLICI